VWGAINLGLFVPTNFNEEIDSVTLFVKWIGTHAEYDRLCDRGKQYTVDKY
jgi:hypothetical protein